MARRPGGASQVEAVRELLHSARTAEELRQAQAVLLPLELGLSLQQTAQAIGRSVAVTCRMRTRLLAICEGSQTAPRSKRDLRNHAKLTLEQEARLLDDVLSQARHGGTSQTAAQLRPLVEQRLGRTIALSTLYRMLARHGWRKVAPAASLDQDGPEGSSCWLKPLPPADTP